MCLNKLEDLQLAMVITRLYEGDMDSTPPSLKRLLYEVTSTRHLKIIIKLGYEAKVLKSVNTLQHNKLDTLYIISKYSLNCGGQS